MTENPEDHETSPNEKKLSDGSTCSRYWSLVLDGAQRDIQTEIGYAEDKISLLLRHRQIELDPNFWCLDDDIVNLLKNGSPEDVRAEIERTEKCILDFKTKLSKSKRMTHFMYSNRAVFHSTIDAFTRLMPIPNVNDSADTINRLAQSICSQSLQLEETITKNVELEMKLASLDDQVNALQVRMKEINKPNELANVQPRLEAVELQNCMLNELLSRIISDVQETGNGMKTIECGQAQDVRVAIREGLILRFGALDECFPNLNAPRNALSKYLWVPHDIAIGGTYTLDQPLQQFEIGDRLDIDTIQALKHLKRSVKDLNETHAKVLEVKRKVLWAEHRKTANHVAILRYSIPKQLEDFDARSINSGAERGTLTPVRPIKCDYTNKEIE